MADTAAKLKPEARRRQRWLCSHLVRLEFANPVFGAQMGLLEEIDGQGAAIAVDNPYPTGLKLTLAAEEYEIPAEIAERVPRETDFLLELRFLEGRQWAPVLWKPKHLFLPRRAKTKASPKETGPPPGSVGS